MTITLEGKWKNLRRTVQSLLDQNWIIVKIEPDEDWKLTRLEMTNETGRHTK